MAAEGCKNETSRAGWAEGIGSLWQQPNHKEEPATLTGHHPWLCSVEMNVTC